MDESETTFEWVQMWKFSAFEVIYYHANHNVTWDEMYTISRF